MTEEKTTETTRRKLPLLRIVIGIIITIPLAAIAGVWLFFMYLQWDIDRIRNSVDPACLASATLRVQIADRVFAFPRKDVFSIAGNNYTHNSIDSHATGSEICQRKDAPAIKANGVSIDVIPLACSDEKDCGNKKITVRLSIEYNNGKSPNPSIARYRAELPKRCLPVAEPMNPWHAIYGRTCRMMFNDKGLDYWIQFRNGEKAYPAENIDNTEKMVIQEVEEMEITNKINNQKRK